MADMDQASKDVSEVDLSDPEDVKALVPSAGSDILVHFGEDDFLRRYQVYSQHVAEWKSANPRLASVDMRYEHQVVLEMAKPGAGEASVAEDDVEPTSQKRDVGHPAPAASKPMVKKAVKPVAAPVPAPVKEHLQTAFDVPAKTAAPAVKTVPK